MLRTTLIAALLLSGCATSFRPTPTPALSPFVFTLTPKQCEKLRLERRNYRAVEKTAVYTGAASGLVTTAFLAIPALRDETTIQGLGAGTALLAGGVGAFTHSQAGDLDDEIAAGGCR
jgi:hypothetical protein